MRRVLILLAGTLVGCQAQQKAPVAPRVYVDRPATMLVFDPPTATLDATTALPRDARERAAIVGYDEVTVSSYYVRQEDRQSDDFGDAYNRSSYVVKSGTSYR